jgi:hypothetical protein
MKASRPAGKSLSQTRASKRAVPDPRTMGVVGKAKKDSGPKAPQGLMGAPDRRHKGLNTVDDPRRAGGGGYEASRMIVTDPRQVAATGDALGVAPPLLGGADVLPVGDPNWQIVGAADFDNDTHVDILWRYNGPGGYNVIWYLNGTAWSESGELLPVADLTWRIVSR